MAVGYAGGHIPKAKRKPFLSLYSPRDFCSGGTVHSAVTSQGESIKYRNGWDVCALLCATVSLCESVLEEKPTVLGCIPVVTSCVTACVGKLAKRGLPECHKVQQSGRLSTRMNTKTPL